MGFIFTLARSALLGFRISVALLQSLNSLDVAYSTTVHVERNLTCEVTLDDTNMFQKVNYFFLVKHLG